MSEPVLLTHEEVMTLHELVIEEWGGSAGLRDEGLLESALAQPRARFGGALLHDGLHACAAAYAFHLIQNHAFIDGKKRIGFAAAATFLELNGLEIVATNDECHGTAIAVSTGRLTKDALADWLRRVTRPLVP